MKLEVQLLDQPLTLVTAPGLFSPGGVDRGTQWMLECLRLRPEGERALDLGCGCGVVGLYLCKRGCAVDFCDIDPLALACTKQGLEENGLTGGQLFCGDGFSAVRGGPYTLILSNPPYHTDFSVAKGFIEGAFRHLELGGRLYMVVKRLDWYRNKLRSVFGGVQVFPRDGYFVLLAEKRGEGRPPRAKTKPQDGLSKKLRRKQQRQSPPPSSTPAP